MFTRFSLAIPGVRVLPTVSAVMLKLQFKFAALYQESEELQVADDNGAVTPTGLVPLPQP